MKEKEEYHPIDLLKQSPAEIGRERVEKMISVFPITPPATDWTSFINLNSILMTSIGAIILAGTIGFLSGESSATTTDKKEYTIENAQSAEYVTDEKNSSRAPEHMTQGAPTVSTETDENNTSTTTHGNDNRTAGAPLPLNSRGPNVSDSVQDPTAMEKREVPPMPETLEIAENRRTFDLSGFTGVEVASSYNVTVTQGPFSVEAKGDSDLLDKLQIDVRSGSLHLGSTREKMRWNEYKGKEQVEVMISLPELDDLALSGSGNLYVGAFDGLSDLKIRLSGSGDITTTGELRASGKMKVSVAGSGDIEVEGSADEADISIAGSGDINGKNLSVKEAKVKIAGSGNISIRCSDELDVSIMGSGDVDYYGSPKVSKSIMGSGNVSGH